MSDIIPVDGFQAIAADESLRRQGRKQGGSMSETVRIDTAGGSVISPSWDAIAELHGKIAAVAGEIGAVRKEATNAFQHYDYTSYEQVAALVKSAMVKHGLAFSASAYDVQSRDVETSSGKLATDQLLSIEATFTDCQTGAMRVVRWKGEGADTQDKATAIAFTSGVKYGLMRMFLFADREVDGDSESPMGEGRQAVRPAQRQAPVAHQAPAAPAPAGKVSKVDRINQLHEYIQSTINPAFTRAASQPQQNSVAGALDALFPGNDAPITTALRHRFMQWAVGKGSVTNLTSGEASALIDWAIVGKDPDTGRTDWSPRMDAIKAASAVVNWLDEQEGQAVMPFDGDEDEDEHIGF